jgi:predicted GNAT family acetyltransferase
MNIQHRKDDRGGRFFVESNGEDVALMVYSMRADGVMIIEHTQVDPELEGLHVGFELVKAGVAYARENGITIVPMCSFANAVLRKHAEFADVLA